MVPIPANCKAVPFHGHLNYHHADIEAFVIKNTLPGVIYPYAVFCAECGHTIVGKTEDEAAKLWNSRVRDQGGGPADSEFERQARRK